MKTIENRHTKVSIIFVEGDPAKEQNYFDLSIWTLNRVPAGGFTNSEMSRRLRLIPVLDSEKETADLEDADMETLKQCVAAMTWPLLHQDLEDFVKYIKGL